MKALLKYLDGKKTYIVAFVMAAIVFAFQMEWIDERTFTALEALFASLGLGTLRAGVQKSGLVVILCLCGTAQAQVQLMSPEKEARLRSYIPKLEDNPALQAKIDQAILYTDEEIPPAYQFQPLSGGRGVPYTVFFSPKHRHNNIDKYTQANSEFPWADPGGLNHVDQSKVSEFRFIWFPYDQSGRVLPAVVYRDSLEKSDAVNMPVPTQGWRWIYPVGTIVGEVLLKKFSDGTWAAYEVRMRLRESDGWDVEVYRRVANVTELRQVSPDADWGSAVVVNREMVDRFHEQSAFKRSGAAIVLPRIPQAKSLLLSGSFKAVGGTNAGKSMYEVQAFTANDDDNIVPAGYNGEYLGTTAQTCANCHQHTLKHADFFDSGRDWYGYVRGSDGIFSFHPIAPDAIRPYGNGTTRIREEFERAGIAVAYDEASHPKSIYSVIPEFKNAPRADQRSSNRRIVGGQVPGR